MMTIHRISMIFLGRHRCHDTRHTQRGPAFPPGVGPESMDFWRIAIQTCSHRGQSSSPFIQESAPSSEKTRSEDVYRLNQGGVAPRVTTEVSPQSCPMIRLYPYSQCIHTQDGLFVQQLFDLYRDFVV
jgi:hypothetical protein